MKLFYTLFITLSLLTASAAQAEPQRIYAEVNGLVCDFCARALEKTFGKEAAVKHIDVNLDSKIITIELVEEGLLSDERIKKLIMDAGYNLVEVRHEK